MKKEIIIFYCLISVLFAFVVIRQFVQHFKANNMLIKSLQSTRFQTNMMPKAKKQALNQKLEIIKTQAQIIAQYYP